MARWIQLTVTAALLALLPVLTGCVKLRQVVTVMPDGSGKIELRFGLSQQLIDMARQDNKDGFEEVVPETMKHKARGIVAFTEPVREKQGNFTFLSYTAYFRDINDVRLEDLGEGEPARYTFKRDGDSASLTLQHGTILSMVADYDEPAPDEDRDEIKKAMAGLAFSEHFILPGTIKPVEGLAVEANTAKLDLNLEHLLEGGGPIKSLKGKDTLRFEVPEVDADADALAAFKQELEAAVKAWQAKQDRAE